MMMMKYIYNIIQSYTTLYFIRLHQIIIPALSFFLKGTKRRIHPKTHDILYTEPIRRPRYQPAPTEHNFPVPSWSSNVWAIFPKQGTPSKPNVIPQQHEIFNPSNITCISMLQNTAMYTFRISKSDHQAVYKKTERNYFVTVTDSHSRLICQSRYRIFIMSNIITTSTDLYTINI